MRRGSARGKACAWPVRTAEPCIASGARRRPRVVDVLATSPCAMGDADEACRRTRRTAWRLMREPVQREIVRTRTAPLKAATVNLRLHLHVL